MIVSTVGLSLKKITRKYGIITSIVTGVVTEPMSSALETIADVAAKSDASITKPTAKNTTNQMTDVPSPPSSTRWPVRISPRIASTAIARIWPSASTLLPITLPVRSARAGTVESRISTTRVCFSSTTDCEIVVPNVIADMKNTRPKPNATR